MLRGLLAHPLEVTLALVLALTPLGGAYANPQGGQVVGGQATIQGQGTKTVTVNQSSQNAIINWNTFNIATGEFTQFNQPNANAIMLNRVTGNLGPSQIYGTITANGRIFLVNPDGILFGLGSRVDAAGFLASTNDIRDRAFMHGHYHFNIPGRLDASIVNLGHINATNGGFAALVAPGVRNAGVITANLGHVALASGNSFTLDFYGDKLITLQVDHGVANQVIDVATGQPLNSLVENQGKLRANGGTVALTAAAARTVVDSVINNTGVIEANTVGTHNGMIVLGAATQATKPQDAPTQNVVVSGTLSARGAHAHQTGGSVVITGESIALQGAKVNASGTAGGGTVLIGGNHVNAATAHMVTMDRSSVIDVSATQRGDGGKVVIWSNGLTSVAGLIAASGGPFGGNGGFVETSGQSVNFDGLRVDTSAPHGTSGLWLLDPYDLIIDPSAAATISANLATTSVMLQTTEEGLPTGPGNAVAGAGDIIINSGIAWSSGNTLTLSAFNGITVNAPINVQGAGGLNISAADMPGLKGTPLISFGPTGSVQFTGTPNIGQTLVINGQSYTLLYNMGDVQGINASSDSLSGFYALAKPIDASGVTGWAPIGTDGHGLVLDDGGGFRGTFQGLGNTISNLTVNAPSTNYVGLFGSVGSGAVIQNVGLIGGAFTGAINVGALVGANSGTIVQSYATSPVTGHGGVGGLVGANGGIVSQSHAAGQVQGTGGDDVGGLVGYNFNGTVTQSYATGNVSGPLDVGGLVGDNSFGTINQSYATGTVTGTNTSSDFGVGGLVGFMNRGSISQSYASGAVSAPDYVGGLVGWSTGTIDHSYATGAVNGSSYVGGFVGWNDASGEFGGGTITQSYSTGAVNGSSNVGGFAGWNGGSIQSSFWDTSTNVPGLNGIGNQTDASGVTGLTTTQFGNITYFQNAGWSFGTTPGGAGCGDGACWVIVDNDGSFNNTSGSGATRPMLLSEWSTTITNAHQLQLIGLNPGANYTLANNIDLGPALANPSDVWGPNGAAGFAPIVGNARGSSILVGQCVAYQSCYYDFTPTSWDNSLTQAQLGSVGVSANLEADQTSPYVIRLGATTITFATPSGPVVEQLPEFSGGPHSTCPPCDNDTVGAFTIPTNATSATIAGTFGNSLSPNSSGVDVLLISSAPAGFSGTFNGNGHTISNLMINQPTQTNVGLFGLVAASGVIENVRLNGGNVTGGQNVGPVVGQNNGTVTNVSANVAVTGSDTSGGLVGLNNGVVSYSSASASVYSTVSAGGLVGSNQGSISQSLATGPVTGTTLVGGLVGSNGALDSGVGTITQSYATGPVSGTDTVGGLVGANFSGTITGSYAAGVVNGTTNVGGLVGTNDASITQSYAIGPVSGTVNAGGLVGTNADGGQVADTYASGPVVGTLAVGALVGLNNGSVASSYWDTQTGGQQGVGTNGGTFGASGLTTAQFGNVSNFSGWTFGTTPGGAGWVIVDADGSLNNAFGVAGATRPMLLSEWSTTITNAHQLQLIALNPVANYTLASNIDLAPALGNPSDVWGPNGSAGFVPIGPSGAAFAGTFEGQGNTINGLAIAPTNALVTNIGLFGVNAGTIQDVNLTNVAITTNQNTQYQSVGTLVGANFGLINNVTASGTINGGATTGVVNAGGLVGQNNWGFASISDGPPLPVPGIIENSSANVAVTLGSPGSGGWNNAGGLVGYNGASISDSSASGAIVVGSNSFAGGLVGTNQGCCIGQSQAASIVSSSATGNVSSNGVDVALGGLVGYNAPLAVISNAQAGGNVTATATLVNTSDCSATFSCQWVNVGGLVGQNQGTIFGNKSTPSGETPCVDGQTCAIGLVAVGSGGTAGGLVGFNDGILLNVFATGDVSGAAGTGNGSSNHNDHRTTLGGLVGENQGMIFGSLASGTVGAPGVAYLQAGGLVGDNNGTITNSIALGDVLTGDFSQAGGFAASSQIPDPNVLCPGCTRGDGYNTNGIIIASTAWGDVTVGAASIAGGFVATSGSFKDTSSGNGNASITVVSGDGNFTGSIVNSGSITGGPSETINVSSGLPTCSAGGICYSFAHGDVTGGGNSILAGFVGALDIGSTISGAQASGAVTGSGANSIVAGFVGVNGGTITFLQHGETTTYSQSSGAVSADSSSYLGGFAGINVGTITDAKVTEAASITATGSGNVVGGFVGVNMGWVDPSSTLATVSSGNGNIVGGFAGGNLSFNNLPSGTPLPDAPSTFPTGQIDGPDQRIATTTMTSAYPGLPAPVSGCTGSGLCQILQVTLGGSSSPPTPPSPTPGPTIDTPPPPQQVIVPPTNNNNTMPPVLVNLTTPPSTPGNNNNPGSNNNGNHTNNAGPPQSPGPPPGPGLGRTYDEQHFSGVPPVGETRFLKGEIVVQISNTVPLSTVLKIAQQLGIKLISSQSYDVNGRIIYRFSTTNGQDIRPLIVGLEKNNIVASAQPNYVYILGQSAPPAEPPPVEQTDSIPPKTPTEPGLANADTASLETLPAGDAAQYVIDKMHLVQIHGMARGRNVVVAVIDSEIDVNHPDLKGDIIERFDATQTPSHPHVHGTGMAGAIAAHQRLLGVAPGVKLLAIKAFDEQASSAEATSVQILKGLEFAMAHKARVINMSFAGPRDPMLERTLKLAHDKGIILVAAAGNAGPKSPPLYPGADPNVIAVTASDYNDKPFSMANRGKYIAVGAPGVDVMVPAPGNTYQLTTGTSVATAHVSGVAALLVERKPSITPDEVRTILIRTAIPYSARPKGEEDGAGLVDPVAALKALGPSQSVQVVPHTNGLTTH